VKPAGRPLGAVALALVVVALAIANVFAFRGPAWEAKSTPLTWQHGPLDGGDERVDLEWKDVAFVAVSDSSEAALSFGVIRRGDAYITLEDTNSFEKVVEFDGGVFVIGQSSTEGPGPTVDVIVTRDDGATFTLLAQVPKPNYQQGIVDAWLEGQTLKVRLDALGEDIPVGDDWAWWWVRPHVGLHEVELRSKNGGRTWFLDTRPRQ